MSTIVVGVDGSIDGQRALDWALGEARHHAAELVAVHAWEYSSGMYTLPSDAKDTASHILSDCLAKADTHGVKVRTRLVEGRPVVTLVREAVAADMLVVGSRGRSVIAAVMLGSVSTGCVHHATCPVVVVPAPRVTSPSGQTTAAQP